MTIISWYFCDSTILADFPPPLLLLIYDCFYRHGSRSSHTAWSNNSCRANTPPHYSKYVFCPFRLYSTVFYFYSDPLQHLLLLLLSIIFCISCLILLQNYATCFNVSLNLVQTPSKEATRKHGALMTAGIITLAGFGFTAFK